jgi:hypothetical protein
MAKHWDSPGRLRGRAAVEQRKRRRSLHPLCAHCTKEGRVTVTAEIDHVIPLALGGTDTDDNVQGLCKDCHARKTADEDAAHGVAAFHPEWLPRSAIPLTIVCGPPASGKTTYVQQHASPHDVVIDLDAILSSLRPEYQHWSGIQDGQLLSRAVRIRNSRLADLSRATSGRAWFIVSAPSKAERDWWATKLGGEVLLLNPGIEECKRRAMARGTPLAVQGIEKWARKARETWKPYRARRAIGLDGWPVEA